MNSFLRRPPVLAVCLFFSVVEGSLQAQPTPDVLAMVPQSQPDSGRVSVINLMAPKKAQRELMKGAELAEHKEYAGALIHFRNATAIYPKYAAAYNEMGRIEFLESNVPEAGDAFEKAIAADPKWPLPYANLAKLQLHEKDIAGMMKTNARALDVSSTLSLPHFFNALGYLTIGRLDDAEKSALLAERTDCGETPQIDLLLAYIAEARGRGDEALLRYKAYLRRNPASAKAAAIRARMAELARVDK